MTQDLELNFRQRTRSAERVHAEGGAQVVRLLVTATAVATVALVFISESRLEPEQRAALFQSYSLAYP